MATVKYSKQDLLKQTAATGLKAAKIPANTTIVIIDLKRGKLANGDLNDVLLCDMNGKKLNIPIREYNKFIIQNGKAFTCEDGSDEIEFPNEFVIVSSVDRKDRDGDVMYPVYAYNDFEEQTKEEGSSIDFAALKASKLKEGNKFEPVQDYTISIL